MNITVDPIASLLQLPDIYLRTPPDDLLVCHFSTLPCAPVTFFMIRGVFDSLHNLDILDKHLAQLNRMDATTEESALHRGCYRALAMLILTVENCRVDNCVIIDTALSRVYPNMPQTVGLTTVAWSKSIVH